MSPELTLPYLFFQNIQEIDEFSFYDRPKPIGRTLVRQTNRLIEFKHLNEPSFDLANFYCIGDQFPLLFQKFHLGYIFIMIHTT